MIELLGEANSVALIGLFGGIILGLAARRGRFCTLGAIEDMLYSSDDRRMRMWGISIGIAIIGMHLSMHFNQFDSAQSVYVIRQWNPVATIIGGLMFGYGMALSGNCGFGALARLGGGDLRSFVIVIVMGLSAYIVMSGPLAHIRVWLFPVIENHNALQSITHLANTMFGISPLLIGIIIGAIILILSLSSAKMRSSKHHIFWALLVGFAIISGWLGTFWVSSHGFEPEPIETHTFAAPIGDTIFYLMTASGNSLSFSVGSIFGVLVGAAIGSFSRGQFRWEACEDPRELRRQIGGACLMGPGAILAVGCSVGQGISAFSLLAYSAPITFICIFIGARFGLRQLIEGFDEI